MATVICNTDDWSLQVRRRKGDAALVCNGRQTTSSFAPHLHRLGDEEKTATLLRHRPPFLLSFVSLFTYLIASFSQHTSPTPSSAPLPFPRLPSALNRSEWKGLTGLPSFLSSSRPEPDMGPQALRWRCSERKQSVSPQLTKWCCWLPGKGRSHQRRVLARWIASFSPLPVDLFLLLWPQCPWRWEQTIRRICTSTGPQQTLTVLSCNWSLSASFRSLQDIVITWLGAVTTRLTLFPLDRFPSYYVLLSRGKTFIFGESLIVCSFMHSDSTGLMVVERTRLVGGSSSCWRQKVFKPRDRYVM